MKMNNYKMLMEKIETKDEVEQFIIINRRIDEIISKVPNPKEALEALMCMFEAKRNNTTSYSVVSLSYAVMLAAISLFNDEFVKQFWIIPLSIAAGALIFVAFKVSGVERKEAFILNALKIKYENEYNGAQYVKDSDIKEYSVKIQKTS